MFTIHNTYIRIFVRTGILLLIILGLLVVLIVQPVFVNADIKPQLSRADLLKKYVYMLSDTIPQKTALADILDVQAEYIFDELSEMTSQTTYQTYDVMGVTYKNIVAKFPGENKNCGTYIVGAHYDTYSNFAGADDNISGVAGLIELARLLSQYRVACDIQLVAYALEEPPYFRSEYMGSFVHAKSLKDNNVDVELMLSLEMIGYFSDEKNSQDYPIKGMQYLYSEKGDFISLVGNLSQIGLVRFFKKSMRINSDLPVYSMNAPDLVAGVDFSDHLNYWFFDYSAIMVTDTAFNRNKNYHTKEDTAEKLDYKRMAKVVDAVYYAIMQHMES